uniref:Homeobox domain-containing protein n=1 Tax=Timema shepardi TaxID=629360 RepID=A0A7R9B6C9_TIMSH|nr:unnamed protein product [Timema shepardi]
MVVSAMMKSVSPQLSPSGAGSRVIRISPDQEQTLEAQFSRVKNPHPTDLVLLAAETGLDERDVQLASLMLKRRKFEMNKENKNKAHNLKKKSCQKEDNLKKVIMTMSELKKLREYSLNIRYDQGQGLNTREFVLDSMLKLSFRYHSGRWGSTFFDGYWSKMSEQASHITIVIQLCSYERLERGIEILDPFLKKLIEF